MDTITKNNNISNNTIPFDMEKVLENEFLSYLKYQIVQDWYRVLIPISRNYWYIECWYIYMINNLNLNTEKVKISKQNKKCRYQENKKIKIIKKIIINNNPKKSHIHSYTNLNKRQVYGSR